MLASLKVTKEVAVTGIRKNKIGRHGLSPCHGHRSDSPQNRIFCVFLYHLSFQDDLNILSKSPSCLV